MCRPATVLAAVVVLFSATASAQCAGFNDCASCAAQPLCGWCPGGGVNGTGACVRGGPDGAFNASDCAPSCGYTVDDFIYSPPLCAASCYAAASAAHCLEQKHCVYCTSTSAQTTRRYIFPADGPTHSYPVGFATSYVVPATARGMCLPAGSDGQPDLRAAYDAAVMRSNPTSDMGRMSYDTFLDRTGTCTGAPVTIPNAGTATARRSALAAVQPLCASYNTSAMCAMQKGCGWCRSTRRCQAFHEDAASSTLTVFNASTCGVPAADDIAVVTSATAYPPQLQTRTNFCESLTPLGCRSCTEAG